MGDLSGEPSMEDILASIKRVIKEGEAPAPRRAPPPPAPSRADDPAGRDAILELNEPMSMPAPAATLAPAPVAAPAQQADVDAWEERFATPPAPTPPSVAPTPAPSAPPPVASAPEVEETPAVSSATVEATRGALGALSRLIVKPEAEGDGTLEGLVREMLRPMLSEWLDDNLPRLVEQMVAREIQKIINQG